MRLLLYSVLRVVLLVAALVALHALGLRSWLLWLVAIVVAALLSYVLLPRLRDAAALQIADSVQRRPRRSRGERRDEDADYEDGLLDTPQAAAPAERPAPGAGDQLGGAPVPRSEQRPDAQDPTEPDAR